MVSVMSDDPPCYNDGSRLRKAKGWEALLRDGNRVICSRGRRIKERPEVESGKRE